MVFRSVLLALIALGNISVGHCQSKRPVKSKAQVIKSKPVVKPVVIDTLTRDKNQLSVKLIQLRDSINSELKYISHHVDSSTKHSSIKKAEKKLNADKVRVEEAIKNVLDATKETWDYYIRETANNTVIQVGYEYHSIKKEILKTTSANQHL